MTYLYTLGGQGHPSLQASQGLSEDITPPGCIASYLGREIIKNHVNKHSPALPQLGNYNMTHYSVHVEGSRFPSVLK